jgi:hypothetical protein
MNSDFSYYILYKEDEESTKTIARESLESTRQDKTRRHGQIKDEVHFVSATLPGARNAPWEWSGLRYPYGIDEYTEYKDACIYIEVINEQEFWR